MVEFSVVIPAWNNAHYLAEAIESALTTADEVIVVDDASVDHTPQSAYSTFAGDERVRLITLTKNSGPGGARCAGLAEAKGGIIGFLDSDDRYASETLHKLLRHLRETPATDIAMGRKIGLYQCEDHSFALDGDVVRMYSFGSVLIRRALLERVSIDTSIRHGEDIDWFMRVQEANAKFELVDDVLQHYRRHATNLTEIEEGASKRAELADVMARSMFRRRKLAKQRGVPMDEIYYVQPDKVGAKGDS